MVGMRGAQSAIDDGDDDDDDDAKSDAAQNDELSHQVVFFTVWNLEMYRRRTMNITLHCSSEVIGMFHRSTIYIRISVRFS